MSTQAPAAAKAKVAGGQRAKTKTAQTQYKSAIISINMQVKGLRVCCCISRSKAVGLCVVKLFLTPI